jgi:hypothetical protein
MQCGLHSDGASSCRQELEGSVLPAKYFIERSAFLGASLPSLNAELHPIAARHADKERVNAHQVLSWPLAPASGELTIHEQDQNDRSRAGRLVAASLQHC